MENKKSVQPIKKPLLFRMIYDDNGELFKRVNGVIALLAKLIVISMLIGTLFIMPFVIYAVIKAILFFIVGI